MWLMEHYKFHEIEEIGSGGYGTVSTAKRRLDEYSSNMQERVVIKQFKKFDQMPELFISEVRNL